MSKFPCSLTRNMTSHSMENLTFHSLLRWKVIILQILATSPIQSLFERLGEYTFWAQEWKGCKLLIDVRVCPALRRFCTSVCHVLRSCLAPVTGLNCLFSPGISPRHERQYRLLWTPEWTGLLPTGDIKVLVEPFDNGETLDIFLMGSGAI